MSWELPQMALSELSERADEPEEPITAGSSLEFLQAIYRSTDQPLARRMRAAIAALPFESPKLAVTANLGPESGFAARLEAAIARSGGLVIEGQLASNCKIESKTYGGLE